MGAVSSPFGVGHPLPLPAGAARAGEYTDFSDYDPSLVPAAAGARVVDREGEAPSTPSQQIMVGRLRPRHVRSPGGAIA